MGALLVLSWSIWFGATGIMNSIRLDCRVDAGSFNGYL
jgi:hypothetical protein